MAGYWSRIAAGAAHFLAKQKSLPFLVNNFAGGVGGFPRVFKIATENSQYLGMQIEANQ